MNNTISSKQLKYSVAAFIIASSLVIRYLYTFTKNESWISVILAVVISLIIFWIYIALANKYPGCSLNEINDAVFGKIIGKLVSALYIFYFLSLCIFNTRDMGSFIKASILPSTPITILYIIFLAVCAWAVRNGASNLTRFGLLFTVISITAILFNSTLLLNIAEPNNLLPVFNLRIQKYLLGAQIVIMLPFCEIFAYMMMLPDLQKPKEFGKAFIGGFLIGAVTLLFVVLRDTLVLGFYTTISSAPSYSVIRLIDVGDILTRLEIIYAVILMILQFYKVSILYYATVVGFSRLVKFESYKVLILIFGVLIIVYCNAVFLSSFEHMKWFAVAPTYSTFFLFVLPALTLLVSTIREKIKDAVSNTA